METEVQAFTGLRPADLLFLAQAAWRTLLIAAAAVSIGTVLGCALGWLLSAAGGPARLALGGLLDVFRSVPLLIQLVLFHNFLPIIGYPSDPFFSGTAVLALYTAAYVAVVARGGVEAVPTVTRRAARSLGMSGWQEMRYVVFPIGLRAVLPSWIGVALGVLKDSALVSALGYVELLRASQILTTRTQQPLLILLIVGVFYFALSYPLSRFGGRVEARWREAHP